MRCYRPHLMAICLLTLSSPALCRAEELFSSPRQKAAFEKALTGRDSRYDPVEKMVRRPFSSPGYHTTLKGGYVHPTRDSLQYAVALLDSGDAERLKRAQDILRRVIALQDQDPKSRTYGIWSWFAEEPLDKMAPPDWNWADFCGTQLLQVAIDHRRRLGEELRQKVKDSIIHAAYSIKRRNVGPGYTNIALMGTYVTITAGEMFGNAELLDYGKNRLRRFCDYTNSHGSFSEYNSPTYTAVAINEITRMLGHVKDPDSRRLIKKLNRFAWRHLARHFHPPTRQWSGPHSRCYRTLLGTGTLAFIQRATAGKLRFVPESRAFESLDAHRLRAECPPDFYHYFTDLPAARLEIETFKKGGAGPHDIIGTTYLHPDFALGSVNIGDLWNQRRPLLAYWNADDGVVAMRLRCLHDDYDYSSASIFTVQDKGDILGAVVFATDRGDTHISLDRLKNATITAKDLRIRLQFEGAIDEVKLPAKVELNHLMQVQSGKVNVGFNVPYAVFGDNPIKFETGRKSGTAWIDLILYSGQQRQINFAEIDKAAVIFVLSLNASDQKQNGKPLSNVRVSQMQTLITAKWDRLPNPEMSLRVPARPLPSGKQKATASAKFDGHNAWKSSAFPTGTPRLRDAAILPIVGCWRNW